MSQRKPGRPPFKPTAKQRRRVVHGIAIGLTLEQLALDIGVPSSTMRLHFAVEIKTARVSVILENVDRLDRAAKRGNVSAARTLLRMTQPRLVEEHERDDWADVASPPAAAVPGKNLELH